MAQIVVPFRGVSGKQRLETSEEVRSTLALAMLGDVLTACVATGRTLLVTDDADARALADELGAEIGAHGTFAGDEAGRLAGRRPAEESLKKA